MKILKKEPWNTIFRIILIVGVFGLVAYISAELGYNYTKKTNRDFDYRIITVPLLMVIYVYYKLKQKKQKEDNDNDFELYEDDYYEEEIVTNNHEIDQYDDTGAIKKWVIFFLIYFVISLIITIIKKDLDYLIVFISIFVLVVSFSSLSHDKQQEKLRILKIGTIRGLIYSFTVLPLMALIIYLIFKKFN